MNIGTIIIAILVFSLLIFVHELGHFMVAKWSKVKVNEFALGMGPKLLSKTKGDTTYSIRAFPIGGFCAMEGENEESAESGAFCNAPLAKRMLITVAGSAMNLLLGLLLLGFLSSRLLYFSSTTVAEFREGATSSQQLQVGDNIQRINGHRVYTMNDIDYELMRDRDGVLTMDIIRDGQKMTLPGVTFAMENMEGASFIDRDFISQRVEPTPWGVVTNTFNWTGSLMKQVWGSLVDLLTGRYAVNALSGPVGVTTAIGQASSMGWPNLLVLVSFITVNLGVFNLLPVPALDGGRMMFLLIELVRRKPINQRYEGVIHAVGFMLLIGLMIFVTLNDVIKLF